MADDSVQAAPRSAQRTILRNTMVTFGTQFAYKILGFITNNIIFVNVLGSEAFGQYWIVMTWAMLFSVIGDLGIMQYYTREIARDHSKANELFWNTAALRCLLAIAASIITTVGAIIAGYESDIVIAIALYTGTYYFQALLQPLIGLLAGNERLDITSVYWMIWQVIIVVAQLIFLLMGLNFVWLVAAQIVPLPITIWLHWRIIRKLKLGPPRFRLDPGMWWSLVRSGLPFAFMQLSLSFAFRVDTVLLSQFNVSHSQIGLYNVAYNLTLMLLSLSTSFTHSILPTLSHEHAQNPDSVRPWYYRSIRGIFFLTLPIAVGGMLTAPKIMNLLYEPEIVPAFIALAILVWDIPFVVMHNFGGNMANSIKRENSAARIFMSLGLVNVIVNLILIPRFGIIGAAFATVLTDTAGAIMFYFLFRREFGSGLDFSRIARMVIAAVVMGVAIYALRDWSFFVILPISAVIYLAMILVLGVITDEERAWFMGFVNRRLRRASAQA
jgi:O-antigen/teichoic acid export membrane protein